MKKEEHQPYIFQSLSDLHRVLGLSKPLHPLVSLINTNENTVSEVDFPQNFVLNFYKIAYKPNLTGRFRYGQQFYDFDEGGLCFSGPYQMKAVDETEDNDHSGFVLFIHPDFLLGSPLLNSIKSYNFFSYSVNEALHLSEKERNTILSVFEIIEEELNSRIDEFSQDVVIAQIDLLLKYCDRFYKRQFVTRKAVNHVILEKLEEILEDYFEQKISLQKGLPSVQYISDQLHITPGYLSDMLRTLIGQNAQKYIHLKLIEKAKEKLSTTHLSVNEIAYELGFEHSQSFSKFFKAKTQQTPLEFRTLFN